MCDVLTRIENKDFENGQKFGFENGQKQTARNFLAMGLSVADVAQGTELSLAEVQALKNTR